MKLVLIIATGFIVLSVCEAQTSLRHLGTKNQTKKGIDHPNVIAEKKNLTYGFILSFHEPTEVIAEVKSLPSGSEVQQKKSEWRHLSPDGAPSASDHKLRNLKHRRKGDREYVGEGLEFDRDGYMVYLSYFEKGNYCTVEWYSEGKRKSIKLDKKNGKVKWYHGGKVVICRRKKKQPQSWRRYDWYAYDKKSSKFFERVVGTEFDQRRWYGDGDGGDYQLASYGRIKWDPDDNNKLKVILERP